MTTKATDYFNSQSPLCSLALLMALHARCGISTRVSALAGMEPGRRLLDLGVTPDTSLPDSNFLERWYPYCVDITKANLNLLTGSALAQRVAATLQATSRSVL